MILRAGASGSHNPSTEVGLFYGGIICRAGACATPRWKIVIPPLRGMAQAPALRRIRRVFDLLDTLLVREEIAYEGEEFRRVDEEGVVAEVEVELSVGGFDSLSQHRQYNLSILLGREERGGRKCN